VFSFCRPGKEKTWGKKKGKKGLGVFFSFASRRKNGCPTKGRKSKREGEKGWGNEKTQPPFRHVLERKKKREKKALSVVALVEGKGFKKKNLPCVPGGGGGGGGHTSHLSKKGD